MEDNRKYYGQQCQNDNINKEFRELHYSIVKQIIEFCNKHNITIDEFHISADDLEKSIEYGDWISCTDSSMVFNKFTQDYKDTISLKTITSNKEFEKIKLKQEPFLFSM